MPRLISVLGVLLPLVSAAAPQDIAPVRDKLLLLTDGKSHYVAVQLSDSGDKLLFYGDGKRFFNVPYQSHSQNGARHARALFEQAHRFEFIDQAGDQGISVLRHRLRLFRSMR